MDKRQKASASSDMEPKDINIKTQLSIDDMPVEPKGERRGKIKECEVENDNILINPDPDSMESRG